MSNAPHADQSGTAKFRSLWNKPVAAGLDQSKNRVAGQTWLTSARSGAAFGLALAGNLLETLGQVRPGWARAPIPWRHIASTFAKHQRGIVRIARLMLIGYSALTLILTFGVIANLASRQRGNDSTATATIAKSRSDIQERGHANPAWTVDSVPIHR